MAKVKRSGKGSAGRKPKGKGKPRRARPPAAAEPLELAASDDSTGSTGSTGSAGSTESTDSMTMVTSVTRSVTVVTAGASSAGAMPVAFAAASVTTETVTTAESFAASESFTATSAAAAAGLAAPATSAELFDVVCSVDSVVLSSVDFGVAQSTARKHNKANPGHDAQPIRQQQ